MAIPNSYWPLEHELLSPIDANSLSVQEENRDPEDQVSINLFFGLNRQQTKEKIYTDKNKINNNKKKQTKKEKENKNTPETKSSKQKEGQLNEESQSSWEGSTGLSVSASSLFWWGCPLHLNSPQQTHKTCASSSPS